MVDILGPFHPKSCANLKMKSIFNIKHSICSLFELPSRALATYKAQSQLIEIYNYIWQRLLPQQETPHLLP